MTQEEFNKLVQEVTEAIQNKSNDPGQYELATSLQGISSLPVLHEDSGVFTLKRVLVTLLKGDNAFETWKKETNNTSATFEQYRLAIKGDRGAKFLYDDFTEDQLEDLRLTWEKLTPSQKDFLKLHFNELTAAEKEEIKGDSGVQIVNNLSEAEESSRVVILQNGDPDGNWIKEW